MEFGIQPVESAANIFHFAPALVVLAMAKSRTAKVKAQHGKAKTIQRLHGMKNNFVVQRTPEQRMGMTNYRRVRRVRVPGIQQGLKPSRGPAQEQRSYG